MNLTTSFRSVPSPTKFLGKGKDGEKRRQPGGQLLQCPMGAPADPPKEREEEATLLPSVAHNNNNNIVSLPRARCVTHIFCILVAVSGQPGQITLRLNFPGVDNKNDTSKLDRLNGCMTRVVESRKGTGFP